MTSNAASHTHRRIIAQGRLWFRFARILEATLREQGTRLWVKPRLHAQYGLRQSMALKTRTFILTSRLEGGSEETLETLVQQQRCPYEPLHTRHPKGGRLVLSACDGHQLGRLNRPAWSWVGPLVEIGYVPRFFLHEIALHQGTLKAHVVIAHFHDGARAYLREHYGRRIDAVLA